MREEIEKHLKERESLATRFKKWCKDKSIPLEDRWKTFVKSGLGDHDVYIPSFESVDIEGLSFERYEQVELSEIIERIDTENFEEFLSDKYPDQNYPLPDAIQNDIEQMCNVKIEEFKEEVLESFIKSFEYDW